MKKIFCLFVILLFAGCSNKQQRLPGYEGPESFDIHLLPDEWEYLRLKYHHSITVNTTTYSFYAKRLKLSYTFRNVIERNGIDQNSSFPMEMTPKEYFGKIFAKGDWDMKSLDSVLESLGENGFEMCGTLGDVSFSSFDTSFPISGLITFYFKRKILK